MSVDFSKPLFIVATTAPSLLAGLTFNYSLTAVPAVQQSNNETFILTTWRRLYELGKSMGPPFAIISAAASLGAAYTHRHSQATHRSKLFIASAVASLSIVPFTIIFMAPTNNALFEREESVRVKAEQDGKPIQVTEESKELLRKWRILNILRGMFPFIGALLAFEAL